MGFNRNFIIYPECIICSSYFVQIFRVLKLQNKGPPTVVSQQIYLKTIILLIWFCDEQLNLLKTLFLLKKSLCLMIHILRRFDNVGLREIS